VSAGLLPRAVRALAGSPDAVRALTDLAALLVPEMADWCLADELQPPDLVRRLVAVGRDGPLGLPTSLGPVRAQRSSAQSVGLLARLNDAPGRRLRLSAGQLAALSGSDDVRLRAQADLALSLGTTDALVLGITSQDDLLGVLTIGRVDGEFSARDLDVLTDLTALAGLALNGARLRTLQRSVSTALQQSLLPHLPVVRDLSLAARFTPAGRSLAVGGDWYDAFALPSGGVALVVGDATGHDVLAAARMAELRNLLRALAVDRRDSPAGTLSRLDRVLGQVANELSGTCVYAQVVSRADGRSLRWSSAGHLPPVLLRDGVAVLLDTPADLMLGVRPDTERHDHERELQVGDLLVLYTDGLVEDRQVGLDERLELLRQLVEQLAPGGTEVLADQLVSRLASLEDDVAVLVVRVEPR
jgi:serine phosphatase RsbU (regulator of sigma subunit)